MKRIPENQRMVRIFTERAAYDGLLTLLGRTLDELNAPSRIFLLLDSPSVAHGDAIVNSSQLAINKSSILFAMECDGPAAVPADLYSYLDRRRQTHSVLSLSARDFMIEGSVHILESGNAMMRIYQPGHPFIALTAASIVGPGIELATPFLAVNRNHVLSAQETFRLSAVMVDGTESVVDLPPK